MFSSHSRPSPYRVATLGFSDFERSALASFFRLVERRVPAYVQVEADDDSDFLVADADQPRVLARIARERRTADTVFIGAQAPHEALAWLTRPIEPVHIMRALDALLGGRQGAGQAGSAPAPAMPAPGPAAGLQAPDPMASSPVLEARARPSALPGGDRQVLVADASATARATLRQRLTDLGYRVSVAASGDEALESAAWTAFAIAFVDLNLRGAAGPDGLQLCQALKARGGDDAAPPLSVPAVVITTDDRNATDKVRGALAGCDAYLTRPLLDTEFLATLEKVDPAFHRAQTTGSGSPPASF